MKIYIPSINIKGLTEPDYEAFFASGFSAGYEDGYESYPCLKKMPLTFDIISGGTIYWKGTARTIEYRKNEGEWISITTETNIDVEAGDTLEFRGNNMSYDGNSFGSDDNCRFSLMGNIMSLINAFFYPILTSVSPYAFKGLFQNYPGQGSQGLCDASNLLLPATTLAERCYDSMFYGCEGLTAAPALPATTLASECYCYMFRGCTNLTTAPELPATTLAGNCYYGMFYNCRNLTAAPELPATTLAGNCYYGMFQNCTSLTTAPELPATTLTSSCYLSMFRGCTSLTKAPEILATDYGTTNSCRYMFRDCTNLNYIKCMFNQAPPRGTTSPTRDWVTGVASTGTFVRYTGVNWPTGNNGIPTGWTVVDADE